VGEDFRVFSNVNEAVDFKLISRMIHEPQALAAGRVRIELLSNVVFWEIELGGGFLLEEAVLEGTSFDDVDDLLMPS
jgi:hypothetical protein